jgi:hypothetical protein
VSAERRYRLLLLSYPRSYRSERADEMLDVLLAKEDARTQWSVVTEAASLVGHGLAQRVRQPFLRRHGATSLHLAGASLLCVLAVLGARQLLGTGLRDVGLDGYPDSWQLDVLWVDPRWPVHTLWLMTGLALLLGRHGLTVVSAWSAAVAHAWLLLASGSPASLPWPGNIGPHWVAAVGAGEASWAVLSVAGAVLVGGPATAGRARADLPSRRWWYAGVLGLGGGGAISAVGLWLSNPAIGDAQLMGAVRGPAPALVLSAGVLGLGLVRAPHGWGALALLGALTAVPLTVRWAAPMSVLGAGALVFVAGYALASLRRAWSCSGSAVAGLPDEITGPGTTSRCPFP